jgi:hypothetical protein
LVVNNEQTTIFHLEICAFVYKINQLGPNFKSNQAPKFEEFSRIKGYIYIYNFIFYFYFFQNHQKVLSNKGKKSKPKSKVFLEIRKLESKHNGTGSVAWILCWVSRPPHASGVTKGSLPNIISICLPIPSV